jgi:hypothetical protein
LDTISQVSPVAPKYAAAAQQDWKKSIRRNAMPSFAHKKWNGTAREASGIKANNYGDTTSLETVVVISSFLTLFFVGLSFLIRSLNPILFRREGASKTSLATYIDDVLRGLTASSDEVIAVAGLDAWLLLEFYSMTRRILGTMIVVVCVLAPIHYAGEGEPTHTDLLSMLDISNLPQGSAFFWVHAICVWFVVIVSTHIMHEAHSEFLVHRFKWIMQMPAPRSTTLLVENIPPKYCSDAALEGYFTNLFGAGVVQKAYIIRKTAGLRETVQKVQDIDNEQLFTAAWWESNEAPTFLSEKMVTVRRERQDLIASRRAAAVAAVEEERQRIERAVKAGDPEVCASSGFVTFTSKLWRRIAEKEQYRTDSTEFVAEIPSDPDDLIYADLKRTPAEHVSSELLGIFCIMALFLFWSPVVVFLSGFTTFDSVQERISALTTLKRTFPSVSSFLEGFLATAVMKLFMAFLPCTLFSIIQSFFTLKAGAWAQLRLERWYYAFLMIFIVFVTVIGRSVLITMVAFAERPTEVLALLGASLPGVSHFYINYLVLDWFATSVQLMRHGVLSTYLFNRFFRAMTPETAKLYSEPESQSFFGMGARLGHGVLVVTISLALCTCSPVIIVFAWCTLGVARVVYGHLYFNVETKKPDTGGVFWIEAHRQLFFALFFYVLLMLVTLFKRGRMGPPIFAAGALVFLYRAWERFSSLNWERLPLEDVAQDSHQSAAQQPTGSYVQPELLYHCSGRRVRASGSSVSLSSKDAAVLDRATGNEEAEDAATTGRGGAGAVLGDRSPSPERA